jgi:DNA-binding FrmR family transcriptional regulator
MSQQINLYDPALLYRREWRTATNLALVGAVLLALVIGWGSWLRIESRAAEARAVEASERAKILQDQVTAIGKLMAERKPDGRIEAQLAAERAALADRQEVLGILKKGLEPESARYSDVLRALAYQTPSGLWLTGLSVSEADMEIRGRMIAPGLVPEFVKRLNAEKVFRGRTFAKLEINVVNVPASPVGGAAATAAQPVAPVSYYEFRLAPDQPGARP